MRHDPRKYLADMLDRASFVREFMAEKSIDDLKQDRVTRSAVERELMVLGEAMYQLHKVDAAVAKRIDSWDKIIGLRHALVHGYDSMNLQIIWDVIHDELNTWITQFEQLLEELN